MARVTIEDCLDNIENRFALVHLAVKRTMQLRKGMPAMIEAPKNREPVIALREIAAEKVSFDRDVHAILDAGADEPLGPRF